MKRYVSKQRSVCALEYTGLNGLEIVGAFSGDYLIGIDPQTGLEGLVRSDGTGVKIGSVIIRNRETGLVSEYDKTVFDDAYEEFVPLQVDFGEALNMMAMGTPMTRMKWSDGAYVQIIEQDGIDRYLSITDKSGCRVFTPGMDSIFATDWTEAE